MPSLIGPASSTGTRSRRKKPSNSFTWIKVKRTRDIVNSDWKEAQIAYRHGAWKAAIVLAGSTIEGLLLSALMQLSGRAKKEVIKERLLRISESKNRTGALEFLYLRELIELAVKLDLISSGPLKFSHSVNDYRNIIHPGLLIRDRTLRAGKLEAAAALSAAKMVARDLGDRKR